jgi:aminoglycoside phosphotransferase (APT) family kinase protein
MSDAQSGLELALGRIMAGAGYAGPVSQLERLSGGANMESWLFRCGEGRFVLRRAPSAEWLAGRPLDIAGEAAVIRAAAAAGVRAPEIVAELVPSGECGIGFIMRCIAGTADPAVVLADPPPELIADLAQDLARIHAVPVANLTGLPALSPAAGVEGLAAQFSEFGADRPVIALGLAWLRANLPPDIAPSLVHGDLRIGNVMAEAGRITGVLDWELAHSGDYHEDIAYGCLTVWRFGRLDKPAFGCADLATYFAAYEAAGGRPVDPARFRFWLVYRTVWWALGCLNMGGYWRKGTDRSLERVVVARRAAEQELDLLRLLETDAPEAEQARPLPPPTPQAPEPHGEPTASEVLTAISEWLAATVKPKLAGRDRFDLAVAQNALGIVRRELAGRPAPEDKALADDLIAGRAGLATPGLLASLRRRALGTLSADQPKYPALAEARSAWENA